MMRMMMMMMLLMIDAMLCYAMLCDASVRLAVLRCETAAMKNCVSGVATVCKWEDSGKAGGNHPQRHYCYCRICVREKVRLFLVISTPAEWKAASKKQKPVGFCT